MNTKMLKEGGEEEKIMTWWTDFC